MITTHKELVQLHGKKVTCRIRDTLITDARISVRTMYEDVFICHNVLDEAGSPTINKLGYRYSWIISRDYNKYENNNRDCTNIRLTGNITIGDM